MLHSPLIQTKVPTAEAVGTFPLLQQFSYYLQQL